MAENIDRKLTAKQQRFAEEFCVDLNGTQAALRAGYSEKAAAEQAYENMKQLVVHREKRAAAKPIITWRYVLFRWNDRKQYIERAEALARAAGIDYLEIVFAKTPVLGISLRRFLSPFYRRFGEPSGPSGRRLDLRAH